MRRFAVDRLKDSDVASRYYDELKFELQGVQAQLLSLDEDCKTIQETIQRVARNTIGYTRKQAHKEWFDESEPFQKIQRNSRKFIKIHEILRNSEKFLKIPKIYKNSKKISEILEKFLENPEIH
jgi:type IV secretory pathway TrbF-like protein